MLVVQEIESAGPDKRARRLIFEQQEPQGYLMSKAVIKELSIDVGTSFASLTDLRKRVDEAEPPLALARCLRLLNARDKTTHELRVRLARDGYHGRAIDTTIDRLTESGLVDDDRFTSNYIDVNLRAKKGWGRIVRELARKGIELDPDDERFYPDPEVEYEAACALIERFPLTTEKERNRALRRLITRGYSYPLALKVITRAVDAREAML